MKLGKRDREEIWALRVMGWPIADLADRYRVAERTIYRVLANSEAIRGRVAAQVRRESPRRRLELSA